MFKRSWPVLYSHLTFVCFIPSTPGTAVPSLPAAPRRYQTLAVCGALLLITLPPRNPAPVMGVSSKDNIGSDDRFKVDPHPHSTIRPRHGACSVETRHQSLAAKPSFST
ncbi:hypothetical protein BDZ89DRAFT_1203726 [Hymenopellis radicata]|nr:hypothetical protein BDZ89DRAFT_1203726 [Hymenopellis radicata]